MDEIWSKFDRLRSDVLQLSIDAHTAFLNVETTLHKPVPIWSELDISKRMCIGILIRCSRLVERFDCECNVWKSYESYEWNERLNEITERIQWDFRQMIDTHIPIARYKNDETTY